MAAGDLNSDGLTDLVIADPGGFAVSVMLGLDGGGFSSPTTFGTWGEAVAVVLGDFNGDGALDAVVAANGSQPEYSVLLGTGDGGFGAPALLGYPDYYYVADNLVAADFNRDGHLDFAAPNTDLNTGVGLVNVYLGWGDGGFQTPLKLFSGGFSPQEVEVGDFNGDGLTDIAALNAGSNGTGVAVGVLFGLPDGGFTAVTTYPISTFFGGGVISGATGDFNGDLATDLAVSVFGSGTMIFLGGDGGLTATSQVLPITEPIAAADLNGDAVIDLVGVAPNSFPADPLMIMLGRGDGTFVSQATLYPAGVNPSAIIALSFGGPDGGSGLAVADLGDVSDLADAGITILNTRACGK